MERMLSSTTKANRKSPVNRALTRIADASVIRNQVAQTAFRADDQEWISLELSGDASAGGVDRKAKRPAAVQRRF
jgi:hypothetical protein